MLKDLIEQNTHKNPALQSPWLAPNKVLGLDKELPYHKIEYPCLVSTKVNGIRAVAIKGKWYSRNMKEMDWIAPSVQELFQPILKYAADLGVVLDGEFHAYSVNDQSGSNVRYYINRFQLILLKGFSCSRQVYDNI